MLQSCVFSNPTLLVKSNTEVAFPLSSKSALAQYLASCLILLSVSKNSRATLLMPLKMIPISLTLSSRLAVSPRLRPGGRSRHYGCHLRGNAKTFIVFSWDPDSIFSYKSIQSNIIKILKHLTLFKLIKLTKLSNS